MNNSKEGLKLKPCPFCGDEMEICKDQYTEWGEHSHYDSKKCPIYSITVLDFELWNTRRPQSADGK